MRRTTAILIAAAAVLAACLAEQENTPPTPAGDAPQITYVANGGFLLEHGGKKVLIDALFEAGAGAFLAPPQESLGQLAEARGPFANVDLLLVTHSHTDHFSPKLAAAYLRNNTRCQLIAHKQVVDLSRREEGFAQIRDRVHEVNLEPGAHERLTVNGIAVDVLCLAHSPYYVNGHDVNEQERNLAFIVDLDRTRFLHLGDATVENSMAHLSGFPFDTTPIDVLFLGYLDRSPAARQFIGRKIKPSRIIAMHVPPAQLAEELQNMRRAYPYAVVFKQSMERRSLRIEIDFRNLRGDYLGQTPPGATPQEFARGIVSTYDQEHSAPAFSPDGNEVFWTMNRLPGPDNEKPFNSVMTMQRENGRWSAPYVSPFVGMLVFSADGRRVYYSSNRPHPGAAVQENQKEDIWVAERRGHDWSEPKCLNLVARSPEVRFAAGPTIARNGTLYFMGYASGLQANVGIFRAELMGGEYSKPELLPRRINLPPFLNWTPFIAPDESYLLFSSNRRDPDHDAGDLYISRRLADGSWTEPVSLGEPVNSSRQERLPGVSPDGKYLFFARDMPGRDDDVYWVSAASVSVLRPLTGPAKKSPK